MIPDEVAFRLLVTTAGTIAHIGVILVPVPFHDPIVVTV